MAKGRQPNKVVHIRAGRICRKAYSHAEARIERQRKAPRSPK